MKDDEYRQGFCNFCDTSKYVIKAVDNLSICYNCSFKLYNRCFIAIQELDFHDD